MHGLGTSQPFMEGVSVGTKGVLQLYHLSFNDNKVLKLSIGYAKSLFKCTGPLSKIYS